MNILKIKSHTLLALCICALAAIFYSYEYLLRISLGIMIPELMKTFKVSANALGNLNAFYYYAYTPMQLPVGLMIDRYGSRLTLTYAVFFCAIGALIFGSSNLLWASMIGRFLIGFGSAFAFVGVLKLASVWLAPNRFAMISGLAISLGMLGAIFGEFTISNMVKKIGWRDTIIYLGYLGLILVPMMWFIIRDKSQSEIYFNKSSSAISQKFISYKELAYQSVKVLASRQILINGLIGGLIYLPTTVFSELWGVQFMKIVHGMEHKIAVRAISMIFFGWAIGGPIAGWLSDKIYSRRLTLQFSSFISALILISVMYLSLPIWMIFIALFLFGIISSGEIICFAIVRKNYKTEFIGTAIAVTNFIIMILIAICQPLVGKILDYLWNGNLIDGLHFFRVADFKIAMSILPIGLVVAGILTFFLKES